MIRTATVEDIPRIVELGAIMHQESRLNVLRFDREKVATLMRWILDTGQFIEVAEREGKVIGGFAGFVTDHWASQDSVAYDCGLFIEPEHRGGGFAVKLVKHFREWAIGQGAKMVTIGINTGVEVERTAKLFELCDFERIGYLYEGVK
jgi:GNAT superfamily N-acetyltransferase